MNTLTFITILKGLAGFFLATYLCMLVYRQHKVAKERKKRLNALSQKLSKMLEGKGSLLD